MASPTSEEILQSFEELNYLSATKSRAALIKRGYKARLKDVGEFVKSQALHNVLQMHHTTEGNNCKSPQ